ncbi:MAG TPA: DUF4382 domain-containing protein [Gammaproteobacteria bacterium]|jgi:hypothetical protein
MLNRMLKIAIPALAAFLLASCGGGDIHGINLAMTDAPIDLASSVNITFSQIELSGPNVTSTVIDIRPASSIDLFGLQGGLAQTVVTGIQAQPGHYTSLILTVVGDPDFAQSNIVLPDGIHTLYVPPGVSSRVVIPVDFTLVSGGDINLTADFNLRKSIIPDPNDPTKYQLIPSIRAVINEESGAITGEVGTSLITCLAPSVYVYKGDVTPTDVDITAPANRVQPFSSALVGFNATTSRYNFTVGFLPAGSYTLAFTCDAALDVANQTNTLRFLQTTHATVTPLGTTFVNFE